MSDVATGPRTGIGARVMVVGALLTVGAAV